MNDDTLSIKIIKLERINYDLEVIIHSYADGICVIDGDGVILKANAAVKILTGFDPKNIIGRNVKGLVSDRNISDSDVMSSIKRKRAMTFMQHFLTGKGCIITGVPVFDIKGNIEKIIISIRDIALLNTTKGQLKNTQRALKGTDDSHRVPHVIAESNEMKAIIENVRRFASLDTTLILLGESGVGKELIAQLIYEHSDRKGKGAFIKVNCAAIPEQLLESEFFGYDEGAFTGAKREGKPGVFELANRGILFLDEIGDLSLPMQAKFLRVLQEKEFVRIGGTRLIKVDTRIITATNKDLESMVKYGEFRRDLFYRLHVLPITIPPLRDRPMDISALIYHYLDLFNMKFSMHKFITPQAIKCLLTYSWPGNVRELSNIIERSILTSSTKKIDIDDLPEKIQYLQKKDQLEGDLTSQLESLEARLIKISLDKYGTTYKAAKALGISQPTFVRRVQKYRLIHKSPVI